MASMAGARPAPTPALERARSLMTPPGRRGSGTSEDSNGYIDLLDAQETPSAGVSQKLMLSRLLPVVYERWWRPVMGQVAKGRRGPGMNDEHSIALGMLRLREGDTVLDLACGPGNFTRRFARVVGPSGLAIGVDASPTMLSRAVGDTLASNVAYVRADATRLPFRDASVDGACCFAALNLFAEPMRALDEIRRVLRPGGRIALFTSCRRGPGPVAALAAPLGAVAGMTMFGPHELTGALSARGIDQIEQRISGITQFVGGRRGLADAIA